MGRKKAYTNEEALFLNNVSYNMNVNMLFNLATTIYQWEGLPETIDKRMLEKSLIKNGMVAFYENELNYLIALPASPSKNFTLYGNPTAVQVFGFNGMTTNLEYSEFLEESECVLCFNNYTRSSDMPVIELYANRLTNIERSLDVNISLQKFPALIKTAQEQKLTMENLMVKAMGNVPIIYGDKNMNLEGIEVLDLKIPFIADKLYQTKRNLFSDILSYFGVESSAIDKKERVQSAEVDSSLGFMQAQRAVHLIPRQQCAEQLNKKYGLNVSVNIAKEFTNIEKILFKGGEDNGTVYNTVENDM